LYNQLSTANARIPPTFADDSDGWSSDEVRNIMAQLKSTEMEDDLPVTAEFQEGGGGASYATMKHHIGLPQEASHAASESLPMRELIGYQREVQNSMLQSKLTHNKNGLFSKSPTLPEFRKDEVNQRSFKNIANSRRYNKLYGNQAANSLSNSTVQLANGDFIERNSDYNLINSSQKKHSIGRRIKT